MARPSKPYYWTEKKSWFVTIKGVRHKLGADEDKAKQEFHRLMSLDEPEPLPASTELLAVEVFDKFLVWTKANREPRTYSWYFDHIQAFITALPNQRISAEALKPLHVTEHLKSSWSPSYTRGRMLAIQRAFKWAVAQGYIDKSPVAALEKPAATRRDNCPTKADVDEMLSLCTEPFKSMLEFAIETGARPHEIIIMEAKHVKGDRIEFMVKESKGKARKRIVYLNDKAKAIIQGREGFLFKNRNGLPWTAYSVDCRFKYLATKTKKKFSAVDIRHYFCDKMIMAGLDVTVVAALMGHTNTQMISRVYNHISQQTEFIKQKLKEASQEAV